MTETHPQNDDWGKRRPRPVKKTEMHIRKYPMIKIILLPNLCNKKNAPTIVKTKLDPPISNETIYSVMSIDWTFSKIAFEYNMKKFTPVNYLRKDSPTPTNDALLYLGSVKHYNIGTSVFPPSSSTLMSAIYYSTDLDL